MNKLIRILFLCLVVLNFSIFVSGQANPLGVPVGTVSPIVATEPSGNPGQADDPAVWVHPTDPSRSLIAGTDKGAGVVIFDLNGKVIQTVEPFGKVNNVDTAYNLKFGKKNIDCFVANIRKVQYTQKTGKAVVLQINPDWGKGKLPCTVIADGKSEGNLITEDSYGMTMYRSPKTGQTYYLDGWKGKGTVKQFLVTGDGKKVSFKLVRELEYPGDTWEGIVVDDDLMMVYVPEEGIGVHKFNAEPGMSTKEISLFATDADGYAKDREGAYIHKYNDGTGYYVVVDQGLAASGIGPRLFIYTRKENKLSKIVKMLDVNKIGDRVETDGIDGTSVAMGPKFPNGLVVAHNSKDSNFLLYDWAQVAGKELMVKPAIGVREN